MTLVARISINDVETVALLTATQAPGGGTNPDDVNSYSVNVFEKQDDAFVQRIKARGIEHRYGDGALALVKKMAELL